MKYSLAIFFVFVMLKIQGQPEEQFFQPGALCEGRMDSLPMLHAAPAVSRVGDEMIILADGFLYTYNFITGWWETFDFAFPYSEGRAYAAASTGRWAIFSNGVVTGRVLIFDTQTREFYQINYRDGSGESGSSQMRVISVAGQIFFVDNDRTQKDIYIYDLESTSWRVDSLSQAREEIEVAIADQKLFFIGGFMGSGNYSKVIDVYDLTAQSWDTLVMANGRVEVGTTQLGDTLIIAGGRNTGSLFSAVPDATFVDLNTLEITEAEMPLEGKEIRGHALGNEAVFLLPDDGAVLVYDRLSGSWRAEEQTGIEPNFFAGSARVKDRVYFVQNAANTEGIVLIYGEGDFSICELSSARRDVAIASYRDELWAIGGSINRVASKAIDVLGEPLIGSNPIRLEAEVQASFCEDSFTGAVRLGISEGQLPVTIIDLSSGDTLRSNRISGLSPGDYAFRIVAADGQVLDTTLSFASDLELQTSVQQPESGKDNGTIELTVTGGSAPYVLLPDSLVFGEGESILLDDLAAGTWPISINDANGCTIDTTLSLEISTDLEFSPFRESVVIRPNPFSNATTLELRGYSGQIECRIYNGNGRLIRKQSSRNAQFLIDLSGQPGGLYFYRIYHVNHPDKPLTSGKMIKT